jgi:peroxiredoxin
MMSGLRKPALLALGAALLWASETVAVEQGASGLPAVGRAAPKLVFTDVLAGSRQALAPEQLQGRVLILNFFSTTCHPCVDMLSHFNETVSQLSTLPVTVVTVSDEDVETVRSFVGKQAISGAVVVDGTGETHSRFFIRRLPFVVVIGPSGVVSEFTYPAGLNQAMVLRALEPR